LGSDATTMSQGSICDAAGHTIYFSIALIDAAEAEQVPAQQNDGAPGAELLGRLRGSHTGKIATTGPECEAAACYCCRVAGR
jgi:hypothetical protein